MKSIEIYTRPGCGYCTHAKRLLASKNLRFVEYDTYVQPEKHQEMCSRGAGRTFPQIFIDGYSIGGFEDLLKLEQQNQLPKRPASCQSNTTTR